MELSFDIGSLGTTTSNYISSMSAPVVLIIAMLAAFFIFEYITHTDDPMQTHDEWV